MCMCRSFFFFFFRGIFFFFTEKDDNVCGCCERHTISTFPSLLNRQKKTVTLRFLFSLLEYLSFFLFPLDFGVLVYFSCSIGLAGFVLWLWGGGGAPPRGCQR